MAGREQKTNQFRQPIVAILGHVDHGKTSLLDYIRSTHRAAGEAGGITQSIGAYEAQFQGRKLTFIDTPGHAAFSKMRSRGASVADLAVLVVAADDGVQPQTIESIKHITAAGIPFIVAINKIDKPGVVPDTAKAQLTEHQVFVEGYGGNTPVVLLSAKTGKGVDSLLENLVLLADLEELPYENTAPLNAPIIESKKDMKKGMLVSAVIRKGTLKVGDMVWAGQADCKVRAIFNDVGLQVKTAEPGSPIQILGFNSLPEVGETIMDVKAELVPVVPAEIVPVPPVDPNAPVVIPAGPAPHLNVILKASSLGSLEAIRGSIAAEVNVLLGATGDVTESDVLLGSSTGAIVLGFDIKVSTAAAKLAETEGVVIKNFKIIYELLEYLEKKIFRLLEPTIDEVELGKAKIIKIFEIDEDKVAGSSVESGIISQGDTVHILRKDGETKNARVKSIRIGKQELKKVDAGKECGILFFPRLDLKEKDYIIAYKKIKTDED